MGRRVFERAVGGGMVPTMIPGTGRACMAMGVKGSGYGTVYDGL